MPGERFSRYFRGSARIFFSYLAIFGAIACGSNSQVGGNANNPAANNNAGGGGGDDPGTWVNNRLVIDIPENPCSVLQSEAVSIPQAALSCHRMTASLDVSIDSQFFCDETTHPNDSSGSIDAYDLGLTIPHTFTLRLLNAQGDVLSSGDTQHVEDWQWSVAQDPFNADLDIVYDGEIQLEVDRPTEVRRVWLEPHCGSQMQGPGNVMWGISTNINARITFGCETDSEF